MAMKNSVPQAISEQQRKGGEARARIYTREQLSEQARKAWRTRRKKAIVAQRDWQKVEREIARIK